MVQRKVAKVTNKLGIQANTLQTEKNNTIIKPSYQNHDGKSKVADLKAKKMKNSRSIKKSNVEISLHSTSKIHKTPEQPGKPPPVVTPINTPSPKKPSSFKSPYTSPNYMKSTSSSEARKENKPKVINNISSTTTKLHKVASSLRTLTKAPSFKHTRSVPCKKVVLCQSNVVQRATCSSTLKDSKFPSYLELTPGATEAEGNSVFKVCPYTYCSLNGHHHNSAPPLKRFLSSRRRMIKSLKVRPQVLSPRKAKPTSECVKAKEEEQSNDFFVEVYVPEREIATQVSEILSDGPCSEDEDYSLSLIQKQTPFESQVEIDDSIASISVCLEEFFGENSDMEWEEGQSAATNEDMCEIDVGTADYSYNQHKLGFELLDDEYPQKFHDEIVECLRFSDTESLPESESTQTGEKQTEELSEITEYSYLAIEATVLAEKQENESNDEQRRIFTDPLEEITEAQTKEFNSYQDFAAIVGKESDEQNDSVEEIIEEDNTDFNLEETSSRNEAVVGEQNEKEADNYVSKRSANSEEETDSSKVKLHSVENIDVEVITSQVQDRNKTEEAEASTAVRIKMQEDIKRDFNKGESDSLPTVTLLESSRKLKRSLRCRKADEDVEEEKEFNPRGPNFLAKEPELEAEKVDLRHQEMDERRNAEEWMLDYALQKTVNQLAPARKRKVALLVEAFESVLPIPTFESHIRRNSPCFSHARPIQACS